MHIWAFDLNYRCRFDLNLLRVQMETQDNKSIRITAGSSLSLSGQITPHGKVVTQLDPSEIAEVARLYRKEVQAAADDLARLINSRGGERQGWRLIQQQIDWIKRFWSVTSEELTEYLARTEAPMDRVKKLISSGVVPPLLITNGDHQTENDGEVGQDENSESEHLRLVTNAQYKRGKSLKNRGTGRTNKELL